MINKKIVYRPHLIRRIKERGFPGNYPRKIYRESEYNFYDKATKHYIAVSKLKHGGKLRKLAISYDIIDGRVEIITIHPVSEKDFKSKIRSKRWQKK